MVIKIITVGIGGGTGNQMFQYAIARSLAEDLNTDFYMNLYQYDFLPSFVSKTPKHVRFNLQHFNIKEKFSSSLKFITKTLESKFNSNLNYINEGNIFTKFTYYNPEILNLKGKIFLRGNFQDERYFSHNSDIIRNDFKIITPPSRDNKKLIKEISSINSVALCIRRGDYLSPFWKAQVGICTMDYYNKAIEEIIKKVENPTFYIFSDDPEWVKDNVKLNYPSVYVSHNDVDKDYEDLRLMSNCKHFIIANSTFHWWGAWLSQNENKIVIAPDPWFNSETIKNPASDHWIKLNINSYHMLFKENSDNIVFGTDKAVESNNDNKLIILKKKKLKLIYLFNDNIQFSQNDFILKLVIQSSDKTVIKLINDKTNPIYIGIKKGITEKYIYIDKHISLNSLILENGNTNSIVIEYLALVEN
ncbi:glycosyl transferase family 11 [Methanobrevibacter cuticularis]|uniref:Glycosyl transferase family 11 n=1 Tax=Methanobrevibacter cuticularis TaxID=47311 RepID=A0A166CMG4_9EURY|nr:alpha-1,2-fucosyltransferase [Methanobrevibacter cuticularis]KZX14664.1 glycosyl transferase family 11 [Methanobrevibacter cuticularis]